MMWSWWSAHFCYRRAEARNKRLFLAAAALLTANFIFCGIAAGGEEKAFVYDSKGKRDPFVSLIKSRVMGYASLENIESVDELVLEGILWDGEANSIAIVNGVILKKGDTINNVEVIKIMPKKVFLQIDDTEHELNLGEREKGGSR